jgi:hypothetical protein
MTAPTLIIKSITGTLPSLGNSTTKDDFNMVTYREKMVEGKGYLVPQAFELTIFMRNGSIYE